MSDSKNGGAANEDRCERIDLSQAQRQALRSLVDPQETDPEAEALQALTDLGLAQRMPFGGAKITSAGRVVLGALVAQ